jgi:hypothetical protein
MSTAFNQLLPASPDDKVQIWIVAGRERVQHTINEFYVKQITNDRVQFSPIVPAPFAKGKFMSVLER